MSRAAPLWRVAMVCFGICLMAGFAYAAAIDITENDNDTNSTWTGWANTDPYEDQEVQAGMQTGQEWDLEGMFLDGNTLSLVGGWDFKGGLAAETVYQSAVGDYWDSGDIFISVNQTPVYGTTGVTSPDMDDYNYDYVLDVDWDSNTYRVYTPGANGTVELVFFDGEAPYASADNTEANPWRYLSGGTQVGGTQYYTAGGSLGDDAGFLGGTHNQVNFDLSWLVAEIGTGDNELWFHFTQECGNDNLMGNVTSYNLAAPSPVPEPASIGLLGLGLVGLVTARIRTKRA